MAMTRRKWSLNALATELGVDRRTIARKLDEAAIKPAGTKGGAPVYRLKDAVRVVSTRPAGQARSETTSSRLVDARTRSAEAEAEQAERDLAQSRRELVPIEEAVDVLIREFTHARQTLLALPHSLSPQLVGLATADEAREVLQRAILDVLSRLSEPPHLSEART
jgi:hypothetical protein